MKKVIFIMGVSGSGKSTVGNLLSKELNIPLFDGDDFHSESSITKMSNGEALNDSDRQHWLESLNNLAKSQLTNTSCIIVCSALKQKYRDLLSLNIEGSIKWVYLAGTFKQILERLKNRSDHYMPSELLKSQFDILEEPIDAIAIDISLSPENILKTIKNELMIKSQIGLFGLGVMGKSLSRNLADKGFRISLFNRHVDGLEENVAINFKNEFKELADTQPFNSILPFINSLQIPRKIMLMVNAGSTLDKVIADLLPYLSKGDILIDGGNSNFKDTKRRIDYLNSKHINFIGAGISGGEEGALKGPSIMPSGDAETYEKIQPFLEAIAARDKNNLPCCTYVGNGGSGHFVKMVHNGIEYVEMQLLAELFSVLTAAGKNPDDIADILKIGKINVSSYLLDITINILRKKENKGWLINKILDKAENKGTGNWTLIASSELGVPYTMVASALFSRYTSYQKDERILANISFKKRKPTKVKIALNDLLNAYQFARIINHYQGFKLMHEASKLYKWNLNLSEIARIWTSGCIIKSNLMIELVGVLSTSTSILKNKSIMEQIKVLKPSVDKVVSKCILNEIAIPCLSDSVNFFNAFTTANSSAKIIQAQRDYFGAHRYQRTDDPTGKLYHTIWED